MADRYSKDNILEYPSLAPERHYESRNVADVNVPSRRIVVPDRMLETLQDLDDVYNLADLLPPDLGKIIKEITDALSKHTQGLIIMRMEREREKEKPRTDNPPEKHPTPNKTPENPDYPKNIDRPGSNAKTPDSEGGGKTAPPSPSVPEGPYSGMKEIWPGKRDPNGAGNPTVVPGTTYISSDGGGTTFATIISGGSSFSATDAETDDIFSAEPDIEIVVGDQDSLVDLSRKAYEQDDADIKEHYTSEMSQITQRFFQVMTALAEDSNMLDYSDLMQDFDGTAVTTSDSNQQHLIDEICRNDIVYDQMLRQMNLLHTAEKTLIMTRGMTAAEGERERYLNEEYKTNEPSVVAGLSNDLLQKNREEAQSKYKEAAYNMYKYLDSAAKMTNAMLNTKIDSAAAKGQLANTGSNIFAYTPPPQPLADDVDDNYDATKSYSDKSKEYIKDQSKDAKNAADIDKDASNSGIDLGGGASKVSGGKFTPLNGKGNDIANHSSIGDELYEVSKLVAGMTGIRTEFILAQFVRESGRDDDLQTHNYGNLRDGDKGLGVTSGNYTIFPDAQSFARAYCEDTVVLNEAHDELVQASNNNDTKAFIHIMKEHGYFEADETEYWKLFDDLVAEFEGS